jgi:pimeloyl-ACP methyl ester carboxylesterase
MKTLLVATLLVPAISFGHEVDKGGHFAAWEQPQLFSAELRAAFRPLRNPTLGER